MKRSITHDLAVTVALLSDRTIHICLPERYDVSDEGFCESITGQRDRQHGHENDRQSVLGALPPMNSL